MVFEGAALEFSTRCMALNSEICTSQRLMLRRSGLGLCGTEEFHRFADHGATIRQSHSERQDVVNPATHDVLLLLFKGANPNPYDFLCGLGTFLRQPALCASNVEEVCPSRTGANCQHGNDLATFARFC